VLVLTVLAGVAFTFGLVRAIASEIPALDPARQARADVDSVIYDSNTRSPRVLAVVRGDESRVLVTSDQISPIMKQAIVAIEDQRFYEHNGIDTRGIARALWQDIRSQSVVEGGSTITQQFVKNAYSGNERSIGRKVREAALAWQLEQQWSKDRILTAYLNTIYFGNGAYGIQQAARTYFGVGARRLTLAQAALLAGIPADPSLYDPVSSPRAAKARRHLVLERMAEQGKITPSDVRRASAVALPHADDVGLPGTQGPAQYFVNYVKDQLVTQYGARRVFGGGLRVTTTIDLKLQEIARTAIGNVIQRENGPAAALVAIDPRTGAVRAMVGGTNFRKSQFNLATQAERQPGSSFKPIVLATAFRQGISPVTTFASKPITIDTGGRLWHVTNYESAYLGRAGLGTAMVSSDNSVYAQLTQVVTPRAIVKTARDLGIRSTLQPYFSLGLGAEAVNPLDMTRAYATIANDGKRVDGSIFGNRARVVETVEDTKRRRPYANTPVEEPVLDASHARLLTSILEEVVSSGTGRRAALADRAAAGKTGTTDNYGDAWFVGYTPQLAVAVWVGYPDGLRPMLTEFGGEPVAGGTLPALIWKQFMKPALKEQNSAPEPFASPPYLPAESRRVVRRGGWRLDNGYCPGTRVIAYFSGLAPALSADCKPNEVTVPRVTGVSPAAARATLAAVPLDTTVAYIPAHVKKRPGVVVNQEPHPGEYLSAGETVRLFVTKAQHGLVPNLVGSSLADAQERLASLELQARVAYAKGKAGTVIRQSPEAGVAAAPGLKVRVVVGGGSKTVSR
jgi:penicillin-binding protein 1A